MAPQMDGLFLFINFVFLLLSSAKYSRVAIFRPDLSKTIVNVAKGRNRV